ncbi:MAG: septal ring lytic transglycosylase RlpA family protein [Halioglobus sp.]|nr:septal ring lytic transglycosylase RlpA family protein [Halioglobus sp.]
MNARLWVVAALVAVAIAACTALPPERASRYPDAHDGAPAATIAAHEIVDAVPRADPLLAAGNKSPYTVNGVTYEILQDHSNYRARGIASWYGTKFNGHKTSNGEIFDLYQATAAHRTLPIPCYARVTNLDNGRTVVVRINDRGPFHSERLIDLSYGAAVKLGYVEQGTARVEVEVLSVTGSDDRRGAVGGMYRYLQLGAFGSKASAKRLQDEVGALLGAPVVVSQVQSGERMLYRVRVGPVADGDELLALQEKLAASGYDAGQPLP